MFRFDRTLIQPSPESLEQTVRQAAATADSPGSGKLLRWPLPQLDAFLAAWRTKSQGWWQWNGGASAEAPAPPRERTRYGRRGRGHAREPRAAAPPMPCRNHEHRARQRRSVVAVAWWSDCIGRRHTRVIGCQRQAVEPPEQLLKPSAADPAVAQVYPDHVFRLTRAGQTRALVACSCGVFGTAEEVGWMGDCCGPCHDRREAGESLPDHPPRQLPASRSAVVHSLAFSGDGSVLAATCLGDLLRVWDVRDGRERLAVRPEGGGWFCRLRLNADGTALAARERQVGTIRAWALATRECRQLEVEPEVNEFDYLPDGRLAILKPVGVRVWDPATGHLEVADDRALPPALSGPVQAVSPDGRTQAVRVGEVYHPERGLDLRDAASGETRPVARGLDLMDVAFSPGGRTLVGLEMGGQGGTLRAWDVATGEERVALHDGSGGFSTFALSPDGRLFATGDFSGRVKLWPFELLGAPGERGA
jgi:hypothetical protein